MAGVQKSIRSFFKPATPKRKIPWSDGGGGGLSESQKKRMCENRLSSKVLLESNRLGILDPNIGGSWFEALEPLFKKDDFQALNDFVLKERDSGKEIYPPRDHVWSWTKYFPIEETKVVILGQDPYHGPGQAHGLCFSVLPGVPPPPSLINMYKELEEDIESFKRPKHGYLAGWAAQGVLLLNAVLTVRRGEANSHKDKGWERLTDDVIRHISERAEGVVFLLWGSYAQKKAAFVNNKKHHLLKSVHPSPLSAHRGFLGSKHFSKCNELLIEQGKTPIDWGSLPIEEL